MYRSSVSSQVAVAVSLIAPVTGSTAYNGGTLPPCCTQTFDNVVHPPRVMPSADSMYSRADDSEYRVDTVMFGLHSGLGMGAFGDSVSIAAVSVRASTLRIAEFLVIVVAIVLMPLSLTNFFFFSFSLFVVLSKNVLLVCASTSSTPRSAGTREEERRTKHTKMLLVTCTV